jgi:two-component system chemotaxis sensor kinase CheA
MSHDQDFLEELKRDFLEEITYLLEQCEESYLKLEDSALRKEELGTIFRVAHSIKGGGAAIGYQDLVEFAHAVEDCLSILRTNPELVTTDIISLLLKTGDAFKLRVSELKRNEKSLTGFDEIKADVKTLIAQLEGKEAPTQVFSTAGAPKNKLPTDSPSAQQTSETGGSIKIDTERIENILNIVGELVVIKSQLMNQSAEYPQDLRLNSIVNLMDRTIRDLQEKTLSMRMTPLKGLFLKMQRIVRDLSIKLQKPIDFKMSGEDIEIDRTMVELLTDPLMHMVRNSLDHGIESSDQRKQTGKTHKGTIHLSASQSGGRVYVKIQDDGGGIKRDKIIERAKSKGLLRSDTIENSLSDKEVFDFIFMPGFSTVEKVTDLSGRGVGMDVVKTNIEKLKGNVEVESKVGHGTTMVISIPLTTSITDGMIIQTSGQEFIMPMDQIKELIHIRPSEIMMTGPNKEVYRHRDKVVPLIRLNDIVSEINSEAVKGQENLIIIIQVGAKTAAIALDKVFGQTQVVLKPLSSSMKNVAGVAGVAILGDGKVALVLDPPGLIKHHEALLQQSSYEQAVS